MTITRREEEEEVVVKLRLKVDLEGLPGGGNEYVVFPRFSTVFSLSFISSKTRELLSTPMDAMNVVDGEIEGAAVCDGEIMFKRRIRRNLIYVKHSTRCERAFRQLDVISMSGVVIFTLYEHFNGLPFKTGNSK